MHPVDIVNSSDDPLDLAEDGIDGAMTELDVPPVLTPDDMTHPHLDELRWGQRRSYNGAKGWGVPQL
jgi:hypothetical protein